MKSQRAAAILGPYTQKAPMSCDSLRGEADAEA